MTVTAPGRAPSQDRDPQQTPSGEASETPVTSVDPPVEPPVDPPEAPAEPAKPKKAKAPLWAKLTTALGVVLLVGSSAGLVGSKLLIKSVTSTVEQDNLIGDTKKTEAEGGASLEGPIDLLLMGVDARKRLAADDVRADTIIILHIPASHDQAYLISIPRDTEVEIPAFPKTQYAGGTNKVNAAFFYGAQNGGGWGGGAQLLAQTLKKSTGISFDGAAIINFDGFKQVIDQIGGVNMCVDQRVKSHHMVLVDGKPLYTADARKTGKPTKPIWHEVGCQDMEGWEALDYSRQRYGLTNGDYDRQRHQQQLIKAMAKKAQTSGVLKNPVKATSLIKAAGEAFVLDTGGVPITDFIFTLKDVAANDLTLLRTNNGTFASTGGGTRETLTPESREMFAAVKQDKLGSFIFDNPDVIAKEK
ncbi:LCP family protein [Micromonosporaceae bacterium Da 78-11]